MSEDLSETGRVFDPGSDDQDEPLIESENCSLFLNLETGDDEELHTPYPPSGSLVGMVHQSLGDKADRMLPFKQKKQGGSGRPRRV